MHFSILMLHSKSKNFSITLEFYKNILLEKIERLHVIEAVMVTLKRKSFSSISEKLNFR